MATGAARYVPPPLAARTPELLGRADERGGLSTLVLRFLLEVVVFGEEAVHRAGTRYGLEYGGR